MKRISTLIGAVCIVAAGMGIMAAGAAGADPQTVVQAYLTGLSNGDVAALNNLIGGVVKARSGTLLTENPDYPAFLRAHYAGVSMTVIDVTPSGDDYQARVRFDSADGTQSSTHTFTLSLVDGQWKIVNEQLF